VIVALWGTPGRRGQKAHRAGALRSDHAGKTGSDTFVARSRTISIRYTRGNGFGRFMEIGIRTQPTGEDDRTSMISWISGYLSFELVYGVAGPELERRATDKISCLKFLRSPEKIPDQSTIGFVRE